MSKVVSVSTPHGGLATRGREAGLGVYIKVSTPHGGLATICLVSYKRKLYMFQLHTVD